MKCKLPSLRRVCRTAYGVGLQLSARRVAPGRRSSIGRPSSATLRSRCLDRDGVYGLPRFHKAAKAAGIRPIVGAELTIESLKSEVTKSEVHHE